MTDRQDLRETANKGFRGLRIADSEWPGGRPRSLMVAYQFSLSKPKQIILVGDASAADTTRTSCVSCTAASCRKIVMLVADDASRKKLAGYLPVVETMTRLRGKATAYVCDENYTCKLPTADAAKFARVATIASYQRNSGGQMERPGATTMRATR